MDKILEVRNVSKIFFPPISTRQLLCADLKRRNGVSALDDVSFSVKIGKISTILGPNGAGKTTLLKIIATLILPDKGSVILDGKYKAGQDDEKIKSLIGLAVSPERGFYPRLNGEQNLYFFGTLAGLSHQESKARMEELFEIFEVPYAKKRFDSYSAGMQQKISLIRALMPLPKLLLLDEPTRSLDYNTSRTVKLYLKNIVETKKTTIIFTTHQMKEAEEFGDYFFILSRGRLLGKGTYADLKKQCDAPGASLADIFEALTKK